jgi:Ca2+-transporting ATPase
MILFAIALAVAAVPEALPAIVTGSLAVGMREMAKRNALVRRMPAVETLGSTTVICSDKTGTLTKGEMTVRGLYAEDAYFVVSGVGYDPAGKIGDGEQDNAQVTSTVNEMLTALTLCNDSVLHQVEGRWRVEGDPTEGALLVIGIKGGLDPSKLRSEYPRVGEVPFSSERKLMTTLHKYDAGSIRAFTKGAPEVVLQRCTHVKWNGSVQPLTADLRKRILTKNEAMASEALRVLGAAFRDVLDTVGRYDESVESQLIFLGLAGMIDPPREEAIEAVRVAKSIRMRTIMITGDHRLTAIAIAREMGIYQEGNLVMTGEDLDLMSNDEFKRTVDRISVYARVSPLHKLRIVKAWKERGEIVAVTGDGVNDAPAVKHADIGVAMGITGTDVTKEASDLILGDDNFATIVKAVELGRWVVDNIKKYLTYLLQCNIIEIILLGGAVFAGLPLPLVPAQILWINLTTDGLPALALGVAPPEPDVMKRPPRDPKKSIFDREVKAFLVMLPLVLAPAILLSFILSLPEGIPIARTRLFFIFVFFELVIALGSASLRYSISRARPYRLLIIAVLSSFALSVAMLHPALIGVFDLAYIPVEDWLTIAFLSLLPLPLMEAIKWLLHRPNKVPVA